MTTIIFEKMQSRNESGASVLYFRPERLKRAVSRLRHVDVLGQGPQLRSPGVGTVVQITG